MLADEEAVSELERRVNAMLVSRLPKSLLKSKLPGAIDLTEIPYHGEHEADDAFVRRCKAKAGTSHCHCYGTLYVVKRNKRYTLAIVLVRRQEKMAGVLKHLLARGEELGLRLKRLYLDRGFDNNGVLKLLKTTQNAFAERFIRTFKEEHVDFADYDSFDDACSQIGHWLEITYNTERIHSAHNYLTPAEFEAAYLQQQASLFSSV